MAKADPVLPSRRSRIERIELRIERLAQKASDLLARERRADEDVARLQRTADEASGWIRTWRTGRALRRRRVRLERLRAQRRELVDGQIRTIMFALQEQSQRTRDELDRQLERLAPVQEQWERLRATFDALEETMAGPAFASLAEHWRGQLEIPEFPLAQRGGYAKPFPKHALLF